MAVIMKMRNKFGVFIIALIMLAIFAFLLQDAINSDTSVLTGNSNEVGSINGSSISRQDFEKKVQESVQNYRLSNNTTDINDETMWQLRDNTWTQYVNDALMSRKYDKLGVKVTSDELYDMVQGPNPHPGVIQSFTDPKTGKYDPGQVVLFLQQLGNDETGETRQRWLAFEKYIKEDRIRAKYNNLVKKAMYTPAWQAGERYALSGTRVDFDFVYLSYADIPDADVTVSESELQSYLDSHKAKYKKDEETRNIEYVTWDIKPTQDDTLRIKAKLDELYENFKNAPNDSAFLRSYSQLSYDPAYYSREDLKSSVKDTFFSIDTNTTIGPYIEEGYWVYAKLADRKLIPDSVKAKNIFISIAGVQDQAGVVKKRAFADSLLKEITEKGADFDAFVQQYSNDEVTKAAAGDWGWIKPGTKYPTIDRALFFKHVEGDLFVVGSDEDNKRGFHIIKITEAKPVKEAAKVSFLGRQITASMETERALFAEASKFSSSYQTAQAFRDAAKELKQGTAEGIRKNDHTIQNLKPAGDIVKWAFSDPEIQVSEVFPLEDKYIVALLSKVSDEGITPLADIKTEIEVEVKQEKKAEMLKKKVEGQTDLNAIAGSTGKTVQTASGMSLANYLIEGIGQEMGVVGKALAINQGETAPPLTGENGVFVIKVTSKTSPPPATDFTAIKRESDQTASSMVEFSLADAIRKSAVIKDNRYQFY